MYQPGSQIPNDGLLSGEQTVVLGGRFLARSYSRTGIGLWRAAMVTISCLTLPRVYQIVVLDERQRMAMS
jgi:hypothetical protein